MFVKPFLLCKEMIHLSKESQYKMNVVQATIITLEALRCRQ